MADKRNKPSIYTILDTSAPIKRKAEPSTEPVKRRKPRAVSELLDEFQIEIVKHESSSIDVIRESTTELLCSLFRRCSEGEGIQVCISGRYAYFPSNNLSVKCEDVNFYRLHCVVPHGVVAIKQLLETTKAPKTVECLLLQYELIMGEQAEVSAFLTSICDAALQPFLMYELFLKQQNQLREEGLLLSYELLRDAQEAVVRCELSGMFFDREAHSGLMQIWQAQQLNSEIDLKYELGDVYANSDMQRPEAELGELNVNSTKQLSEALSLYMVRKKTQGLLKDWPRGKSGQLKTDSGNLKHYGKMPGLERVTDLILSYRTASKLLSTYGRSFSDWVVDSRIHTRLKLNGCVTGRMSSSDPNLQNIPNSSDFRSLFKAPPGYSLIVGDYSQIELRVVAMLARDQDMIRVFDSRKDLHLHTAASLLKIAERDVTPEQRQLAKAVNFGMLYGQGAPGLSEYAESQYGVKLSLAEAKAYITEFYRTYPGLKVWQNSLKSSKIVTTPLGRKRKTSVPMEKQNTPIQGGAAEVMLKLLAKLRELLRFSECKLVNIVHDEVILEVSNGVLDDRIIDLKRIMQEAWAEFLQQANLDPVNWDVAKVSAGPDWHSAKLD